MKTTITKAGFVLQWPKSRQGQFSREGLEAIYDYLIEIEEGTGQEIEYDPIAICCEFTEYEDIEEFNEDYHVEHEDMEELRHDTTAFGLECGGLIVKAF